MTARKQSESTALADAVDRTVTALKRDGLIEDRHAAHVQLVHEMAEVIRLKVREGKGLSTVSNDVRVMQQLLDSFLPKATALDGVLRDAMAKWEEEIARAEAAGDGAA